MTGGVRADKRIAMLVFLILLSCYAYFFPRWADWNQNSRLNLVMAIVDRGVLYIDDYYQGYTATGDYAVYAGHVYSTKAPGSAFLGVPVYWGFGRLVGGDAVQRLLGVLSNNEAVDATLSEAGSGLLSEKFYLAMALFCVTCFTTSIPSALLGVGLYYFLGDYVPGRAVRVAAVLIYGLATIAFPYASCFYGHQTVAALLFGAFCLAHFIGRGRIRPVYAGVVGLMLGYAIITEYPAVLGAALVFFYLLYRLPRKQWIGLAVLGGLMPGLLWMAYNMAIFGQPIAFGYQHSQLFEDVNTTGFFSLVYPQPDALWGITFGSFRGLFFLSPVLLLALPGFVYFARRRDWCPECAVSLGVVVAFLLFNASSVMWQGGYGVGPRYLVPMLPFLVLPLALCLARWGARRWAMVIVGALTAWSFLAVWAETIGGQQFPDYTRNPLFRYSLPRLIDGDVARNWGTLVGLSGSSALLPLVIVVGLLSWFLFRQLTQKTALVQTGGAENAV